MDKHKLTAHEKSSMKVFFRLTKDYKGLFYLFVPLSGIPVAHFKRTITGCKISTKLDMIYIETKYIPNSFDILIGEHPSYLYTIRLNDITYIVLKVLPQYIPTLQLMIDGKYTEIEDKMKTLICRESSLPYITKSSSKGIKIHFLLQAFYEGNDVRELLAIVFDVSIDNIPKELIGAIPKESKMYIENCI